MSSDTDSICAPSALPHQQEYEDRTFITPGIAALGPAAVKRLVQTIATFDDFYRATDPKSRPDNGVFDTDGVEVWFKIDVCDRPIAAQMPGAPRILRTILLALVDEFRG